MEILRSGLVQEQGASQGSQSDCQVVGRGTGKVVAHSNQRRGEEALWGGGERNTKNFNWSKAGLKMVYTRRHGWEIRSC